MVIAGESVASGRSENSMNLKVCSKMMCLECSHKVVRLIGKKWKADAEYLFFRNYVRDTKKLMTKALDSPGSVSYTHLTLPTIYSV